MRRAGAPDRLVPIPKRAAPSRFRPHCPRLARQISPKWITTRSSDEKTAPVPGMMRTCVRGTPYFYAVLMRKTSQIRTKRT
ncbi:hypothetical protein CFB52_022660 [Burkholderia sp. AU18528]|nr:hypothetical protein CFB52_022660 [Burkholderia sp. AU18528]